MFTYISDKYHYFCIFGDFNLPDLLYHALTNSKPSPVIESELSDSILSLSLVQCVHEPTRRQNFLDLMFYSQYLDVGVTRVALHHKYF